MIRPPPVLQAPGSHDCAYATAAYICRLFGHEATIEAVRDWRHDGRRYTPECYPEKMHGVAAVHLFSDFAPTWWLRPGSETWVRDWLDRGHVAFAVVHSGGKDMHAVALLDADGEGVTIADPLVGITRWTWARFLGKGPGVTRNPLDVHYVSTWYGPIAQAA